MIQAGDIYRYDSNEEVGYFRYFLFLQKCDRTAPKSAYPVHWNLSEVWTVIDLQTGLTRELEYGIYRHCFTKEV